MHDQLISNINYYYKIFNSCNIPRIITFLLFFSSFNLILIHHLRDRYQRKKAEVFFPNFLFFASSIPLSPKRFSQQYQSCWISLKWPNRSLNVKRRGFAMERLDFRLVIEKAGSIVQRWKLISKIQLVAAWLSRDLLSMQLDFGRNQMAIKGTILVNGFGFQFCLSYT